MSNGPLLKVEDGYSRARLRTMANPIPLLAPVTAATRLNDMAVLGGVGEQSGFGRKTFGGC